MEEKDFDRWNIEKKSVQKQSRIFFDEKDIWWAYLGLNVGNEQDGHQIFYTRPVLILKMPKD